MRNRRQLTHLLSRYQKRLAAGVLSGLLAALVGFLIPSLIGRAVDEIRAGVTWGALTRYALTVAGVSLLSGALTFLFRNSMLTLGYLVDRDLRLSLYARLQRMSFRFHEEHHTGDLMAHLTNDVAAVRDLTGMAAMYGLQACFSLLIVIPLMFRISPALATLLFVLMPLTVWTTHRLGRAVQARYGRIQGLYARISSRIQESVTHAHVIRAHAMEESEVAALDRLSESYMAARLEVARLSALTRPLAHLFVGAGFALIIWYGGWLAVSGRITLGQFTEFNLYLLRLIWPLVSAGEALYLYEQGMASLKRINAIAPAPAAADALGGGLQRPPPRGRVEFRAVSFRYPAAPAPALTEVNVGVEPGQTVAFVGRTGSGKTTLMNLVPRLLEASGGAVLVDGIPVEDYPLAQLRGGIGYVTQETFLFSGTISENIAFGVERARRAEIAWAAEVAGLADDLRGFPRGLNTVIGERGITLSGGQRQRTAIARALLRRPRIIILDDALSAVDIFTEERILLRLREEAREAATLVASHRIAAIRGADLIYVLEEGRVAESGTHGELLARGGLYAGFCRRQLSEEEPARC